MNEHTPEQLEQEQLQVVNIPSHDPARGEVAVAYMPPEPAKVNDEKVNNRGPCWSAPNPVLYGARPPLQGKHRILFLLYKQQARVTVRPPSKRQGFQVRAFEKEHHLGSPAAGLFVWAENAEE